MNQRKKRKLWGLLLFLLPVFLMGCKGAESETGNALKAQEAQQAESPVIGLILTSEDASENETMMMQFEELAEDLGAELLVRIPEVTDAAAEEARNLTEDFILYEVDPIEYQLLYVNEMVAEDVDVIAIHANHPQALEGVLAAARSVDISICAFEQEVGEESCDVYVPAAEAAEAVRELLSAEE